MIEFLLAKSNGDAIKEVRKTILAIYKGFEKLDARLVDQNFSHGGELLAFGTDWDEKFVGWKGYKDVHTVQFKALSSMKFRPRELSIHCQGKLAWISDRPHWEIVTKKGEKINSDVRLTAVLKKDESKERWLVVQWHVSVGMNRLHDY